jgi:hypothetical protein
MSIPTFGKNIQGNKTSEPETRHRNLFLIAAHFWLDKYQKQSSLLRLHLNAPSLPLGVETLFTATDILCRASAWRMSMDRGKDMHKGMGSDPSVL